MIVARDPEGAASACADLVGAAIRDGVRSLVLTGGTTPRRCYELLAGMDLEWGRVSVLFGDERCVPPDDPGSNYRMARETLLDRVAPRSVHRMPGELGAEAAAAEYEAIVAGLGRLDLVLLGLGEDGHTASLFPGNAGLDAPGLVTAVHDAPKAPPDRVSLTLRALNTISHRVVFLATGSGKRDALARARRGEVPAGMVENAEWIIDRAVEGV